MPESAVAHRLSLVYTLDGRPAVFPLPEGATTVGSSADNDLVLEHPSVGPHQVVILRDGDTVELRDLFAGETRVNDAERRSGPLAPGDLLALGEVRLRVLRVSSSAGATPSAEAPAAPATPEPVDPDAPAGAEGGTEPAAAEDDDDDDDAPGDEDFFAASTALGGDDDDAEADLFGVTAEAARVPEPAPPPEPAPAPPADDPDLGPRSPEEGGTARYVRGPRADDEELRRAREREARRARALARARQLSDELSQERDFEETLELVALALLDVFAADRAVTILFEEDGKNPLLTVERTVDDREEEDGVAQEIVERCLQVRSVLRIASDRQGLDGLAAPVLSGGRALGLLYFERSGSDAPPVEPEDVHLMAMVANQASLVIAAQILG